MTRKGRLSEERELCVFVQPGLHSEDEASFKPMLLVHCCYCCYDEKKKKILQLEGFILVYSLNMDIVQ